MKKILLIMLVLGLTLGFTTSCSKKEEPKKTEDVKDAGKDKVAEAKTDAAKSGPEDVNKWIDDYEKLANELIDYMKKAKEGDASILQKVQDIMSKLNDFQKRSAELAPKMTPEQTERLMKLASKITEASQNMAK